MENQIKEKPRLTEKELTEVLSSSQYKAVPATINTSVSNQSMSVIMQMGEMLKTPGITPELMKDLYAMHRESIGESMRMAYYRDMSLCQGELPSINKNGAIVITKKGTSEVIATTPYSEYSDIMDACQPVLSEYGFAIDAKPFQKKNDDPTMPYIAGCHFTISHNEGHQETTSLELPFDTSGFKNSAQAVKSSASYSRRIALIFALNIREEKDSSDDDGQASGKMKDMVSQSDYDSLKRELNATKQHLKRVVSSGICVRNNLDTVINIRDNIANEYFILAIEAWDSLEEDEQQLILLAPTKGGPFGTKMRDFIKDGSLRKAAEEQQMEKEREHRET